MPTKRLRGAVWEYVVKRSGVLPRPIYLRFDSEREGDAYVAKLESMLDRGIVPPEFIDGNSRAKLLGDAIKQYLLTVSVTRSETTVLNVVRDRVGTTELRLLTYVWVETWIKSMKRDRLLSPSTIRHHVGALGRCLDWVVRRGGSELSSNPIRSLPTRYAVYNRADASAVRDRCDEAPRDEARERRLDADEETRMELPFRKSYVTAGSDGTATVETIGRGKSLARRVVRLQSDRPIQAIGNRPLTLKQGTTSLATFEYDVGTNAKGQLDKMTDSSGQTTYVHDQKGRRIQKVQTVGTINHTVSYGYDGNDRLASVTYPSGKVVTYVYSGGQLASISVGATVILNNLAYHPFGPAKSSTWGNAATYSRSFDADGRMASFPLAAGASPTTKTLSYDLASRVQTITQANPAATQTLGYDNLDRLSSAVLGTSSFSYGYDATGNRSSLTVAATNYPYTIATTSNRLTNTAGPAPVRTYTYLSDGLPSNEGTGNRVYTYDGRERLATVTIGSSAKTYSYNGRGERVKKTGALGGNSTNYFVYDEQGHLVGEYTSATAVVSETVWMGDQPVAVLIGTAIYYVYADQLNTPRAITNTSNQLRWTWDSAEPFGNNAANENPASLEAFAYNLRFPGQYLDKETGLHYNYYRDYDPSTGRYVQSDPIGLAGGLNTYLYVGGAPLMTIDPMGLASCSCKAMGPGERVMSPAEIGRYGEGSFGHKVCKYECSCAFMACGDRKSVKISFEWFEGKSGTATCFGQSSGRTVGFSSFSFNSDYLGDRLLNPRTPSGEFMDYADKLAREKGGGACGC